MLRFIASFALVWGGLLAWGLLDPQAYWRFFDLSEFDPRPLFAAKLLGIPLVTAWFTLDILQRLRPRQAFDPRARRPLAPILAGLAAALASIVLTAGILAIPSSGLFELPESLTGILDYCAVTISCIAATAVATLPLRRAVPGHCIHCNYDLSGSPGGRCPECGALGSVIEPQRHALRAVPIPKAPPASQR